MAQNREVLRGGLAAATAASVALSLGAATCGAQDGRLPLKLYGGEATPNAIDTVSDGFATGQTANPEVPPQGPTTEADMLRKQLAKERATWHAERRRLVTLAYAKRPIERTALQLAHAAYGVPINGLVALASCESGRDPGAQNKKALSGAHATGYTQILYSPSGTPASTWHTTPYAELSPKDLTTNILAAGYIWRRNDGKSKPGFGEWRDICAHRADAASSHYVTVSLARR